MSESVPQQKFDIEHQYQIYLQRSRLREWLMGDAQRVETRRAFYGACGQMLILLRDEVTSLEDLEAIETLSGMERQVQEFFKKESGR